MTYKSERKAGKALNREEVLNMASDVAKKLYSRISAERYTVKKTDADLLSMIRAWNALISTIYTIQKDEVLEEMDRRLTELEEGMK